MDANNLLVDKSMKQITFREEVMQRAKIYKNMLHSQWRNGGDRKKKPIKWKESIYVGVEDKKTPKNKNTDDT